MRLKCKLCKVPLLPWNLQIVILKILVEKLKLKFRRSHYCLPPPTTKVLSPFPKFIFRAQQLYEIKSGFHRIVQFLMPVARCEVTRNDNWRAPSNSVTIHNLPFGLKSFAKADIALQNDARNCFNWLNNTIYRYAFLASILQSHVWVRKTLEPEWQTVDFCTTA